MENITDELDRKHESCSSCSGENLTSPDKLVHRLFRQFLLFSSSVSNALLVILDTVIDKAELRDFGNNRNHRWMIGLDGTLHGNPLGGS